MPGCHHKMALLCGARGFALFICNLRGGTTGISLQLKGVLSSRCRGQEMPSHVGAPCECAGVCIPACVVL